MTVDPQVQTILDAMAEAGGPPMPEQTIDEARAAVQGLVALGVGPEGVTAHDTTFAGPAGDVPVRIYRPSTDGVAPVLVWYHGGGWVLGDLEWADAVCRSLCIGAGAVVVSVDYRLAPEHRFPAAVDDAVAALRWVASEAERFGGDPARIAVGGDSAGGNLSAVVAQRTDVPLRFQLLVYPVTDCRCDSKSHETNGDGYLLTHATMRWFVDHYLGTHGDLDDPAVSPLRAGDLTGLPPALVITAEYDPLRDEGEAYAEAMRAAGVEVTVSRYDGMIHAFFGMNAVVDAANRALDEASAALRTALS